MPWKTVLFEEKSFWDVYVKARRITGSRFNRYLVRLCFVVLVALVVSPDFYPWTSAPGTSALIKWVREWADIGVSFTTSILGFLVAGFSIFATITKNELFVALANIPYRKNGKETGISQFKFIFFNFIIVFIHYLAFLSACLFISLLLSEGGLITMTVSALTKELPVVQKSIASFGVVIMGSWFVSIVLMLKSFIWNLYQSVLLSIASEAELEERKKQE